MTTKIETKSEEVNFNFLCPFCKKEVKDNDIVRVNPNNNSFAHESCVLKAQEQYDKDKEKHKMAQVKAQAEAQVENSK